MYYQLLTATGLVVATSSCTFKRTEPSSFGSRLENSKIINIVVDAKIPEIYNPKMIDQLADSRLAFPPGMLDMAKINRSAAELRSGPSTDFTVLPSLLPNGSEFVVIQKSDRWLFGTTPDSKLPGWLHTEAANPIGLNDVEIVLPAALLPKVFAKVEILHGWSFPSQSKIDLKIPAGSVFRSFATRKRKILVWIPDSNGILWLPKNKMR